MTDLGNAGAAVERRVLVPQRIAARAPVIGGRVHVLNGLSMGTTWSVRLVGAPRLELAPIARAIQRELDEVVAQMSSWDSESHLARFNRAAAGSWHALPEAFFEVLQFGLTVARDSAGAFDPSAGALVNAWGFGPKDRYDEPGFEPPADWRIENALATSGWQRLQLDPAMRRVRQPGDLQLDLSAIAKGYAVDRVASALQREFRVKDALVEVGGELRGSGLKPDGQPWWVRVESPPGRDELQRAGGSPLRPTWLALHDLCVATSGDYRRCFLHRGVAYPHTVDPRHGRPIDHGLSSVTVLHASCMAADALSTALCVLGAGAGLAWAEQRGIAALFVTPRANGSLEERLSSSFAELAA